MTGAFAVGFLRRKAALFALFYLAIVVLAAIAAPLVSPYDPLKQDLRNILAGPTPQHLLGTDNLGRDTLARLIYGARSALLSVVAALAPFILLGVPLGLVAGYFSGWPDRILRS